MTYVYYEIFLRPSILRPSFSWFARKTKLAGGGRALIAKTSEPSSTTSFNHGDRDICGTARKKKKPLFFSSLVTYFCACVLVRSTCILFSPEFIALSSSGVGIYMCSSIHGENLFSFPPCGSKVLHEKKGGGGRSGRSLPHYAFRSLRRGALPKYSCYYL